jgi:hydroxyacylglutathione hydrolase
LPEPLEVRACAVGPWRTNAYALVCRASGRSVLVDPAAEPSRLLALLEGTRPAGILVTHSHRDHVGALAELRAALGVPVAAHGGPYHHGSAIAPDRVLRDGEAVAVGEHRLRVHAAPGHARDHLCFQVEGGGPALVGDVLFSGGPGMTSSPEAFLTQLHTLRHVVLPWPDDTVCHPGHGAPFRLGDLRPRISAFVDQDPPPGFSGASAWPA